MNIWVLCFIADNRNIVWLSHEPKSQKVRNISSYSVGFMCSWHLKWHFSRNKHYYRLHKPIVTWYFFPKFWSSFLMFLFHFSGLPFLFLPRITSSVVSTSLLNSHASTELSVSCNCNGSKSGSATKSSASLLSISKLTIVISNFLALHQYSNIELSRMSLFQYA